MRNIRPSASTWIGLIALVFLSLPAGAQELSEERGVSADAAFAPLSISLNGTDSHLTVQPAGSLSLTGSMTIEAWVKPNNLTNPQTILERYNANVARDMKSGYGLAVRGGILEFSLCSGEKRSSCFVIRSASALTANVWQHAAAVFDGTEARIYINGQLSGRSNVRVRRAGATTGELTMGASREGGDRFLGLMDEIRVSNMAVYQNNFDLSAQLTSQASSVGLWRFDNGSPNDWSSYGNSATMSGGATFSPDVPSVPSVAFRIVPSPNVGPSNKLHGVKVVSPTEVWAVGDHGPHYSCCFPKNAVAIRYDGTSWTSFPLPAPFNSSESSTLLGIEKAADSSLWAFGTVGQNDQKRVALIRWDGTSWTLAATATDPQFPDGGIGTVKGIAVISDSEVWLVGSRVLNQSWTLRWDGTSLTTIPSPNLDMGGNALTDVDGTSPTNIYAVGSFIAIRWDGTQWLPVPQVPRSIHYRSLAVTGEDSFWLVGQASSCGPFQGCTASQGLFRLSGGQFTSTGVTGLTASQVGYDSLDATGPDNVWLSGFADARTFVARFDGTVWRRVPSQSTPTTGSDVDELLSISTLSTTDVWTVGYHSDVFYEPQYTTFQNTLVERRELVP